ncbi:MAG: hypothetical protein Q9211_006166, partial [Gyalolechia sp. 1 TL-2023]
MAVVVAKNKVTEAEVEDIAIILTEADAQKKNTAARKEADMIVHRYVKTLCRKPTMFKHRNQDPSEYGGGGRGSDNYYSGGNMTGNQDYRTGGGGNNLNFSGEGS